jgi:hypothetical protein
MSRLDTWLRQRNSAESVRQLVFLTIHTTATALAKDTPMVRGFVSRLRDAADGIGAVGLPQAHDSEIAVHVYGPDADAMLSALAPVVQSSPDVERAWALVRYGDIGARETQVILEGVGLQRISIPN